MTVFCEYVGQDIPPCPDDCTAKNIFVCIVNTKQSKECQSSTSRESAEKCGI